MASESMVNLLGSAVDGVYADRVLLDLFERSGDVLMVADAQCVVEWVSNSAHASTGWDRSLVVGHSILEFVHPEDLQRVDALLEDRISGTTRTANTVVRMRTARGVFRWQSLAVGKRTDGLAGVVIAFRDVDEFTTSQEFDRYRAVRARAILDAEVEPQVLVTLIRDPEGTVVDLEYLEANAASCCFLGRAREDLIGEVASQVAPWSVREQYLRACEEVQRTGQALLLSAVPGTALQPRRPGEAWRVYDVRLSRVDQEILVAWSDVTDREAMLRGSAEQQELLQATLDAEIDPHIRLVPIRDDSGTITDFRYVMANDAACRYNNVPREELVGTRLLDLLPAHDESGLFERYVEVMTTGVPLVLDDTPYEQELRGGETRYYDIRATRVGDGLSYIWRDVTQRHLAVAALAAEQEQFRTAMEAAPFGQVLADPDGRLLKVNPAMCVLLGRDEAALEGSAFLDITHPEDRDVSAAALAALRDGRRDKVRFRKRYVRPDGSNIHAEVAVSCVREPDGRIRHFIAQVVDVTAAVEAEEMLHRMARTDTVTGLPNRHEVMQRLEQLLHSERRQDGLLALAFCDIDNFKAINDAYGHAAGDRVLQTIADRISASVRDSDTVARFGGDELVVVFSGVSDPAEAKRLAEKIRVAVCAPAADPQLPDLDISVSVGVAVAESNDSVDALVARADDAMYQAKRSGRNRTVGSAHLSEGGA